MQLHYWLLMMAIAVLAIVTDVKAQTTANSSCTNNRVQSSQGSDCPNVFVFQRIDYRGAQIRIDVRYNGQELVFRGDLPRNSKIELSDVRGASSGRFQAVIRDFDDAFITAAVSEKGRDVGQLFVFERHNSELKELHSGTALTGRSVTLDRDVEQIVAMLGARRPAWNVANALKELARFLEQNPTLRVSDFLDRVETGRIRAPSRTVGPREHASEANVPRSRLARVGGDSAEEEPAPVTPPQPQPRPEPQSPEGSTEDDEEGEEEEEEETPDPAERGGRRQDQMWRQQQNRRSTGQERPIQRPEGPIYRNPQPAPVQTVTPRRSNRPTVYYDSTGRPIGTDQDLDLRPDPAYTRGRSNTNVQPSQRPRTYFNPQPQGSVSRGGPYYSPQRIPPDNGYGWGSR